MDKRQKQGLVYILISLLGLVVITGAALWIWQPKNVAEYHDPRRGFSLKYPAEWKLIPEFGQTAVKIESPLEYVGDPYQASMNVVVQDLSANPKTLNEYSELAIKQVEAVFKQNVTVLESKSQRLAGNQGHKFVFIGRTPPGEPDLKYQIVWTLADYKAYQVTLVSFEEKFDEYRDEVNLVLKSFRID